MAAYRRVYDSRHLQADCQEPGSAPEPYVGNRVWATFTTKVIVIKFAECGTSSPYLSPLLLFWSNVGLLASDPSDDFQRTATLGCSAAATPCTATPLRRSMPRRSSWLLAGKEAFSVSVWKVFSDRLRTDCLVARLSDSELSHGQQTDSKPAAHRPSRPLPPQTRLRSPALKPTVTNRPPHIDGNVTSARWQVTLCDPMWHVSSRSGVATLRTAIHLLLTYLLHIDFTPFKTSFLKRRRTVFSYILTI